MRRGGFWRIGFGLLAVGVLLTVGCSKSEGGKKIIAKGKVTVDGNPTEGVVLTFFGPSEKVASGITTSQADGSYEVIFTSQAGDGNYKVTATKWQMKKGGALPPSGEGLDLDQLRLSGAAINAIPDRYGNVDQSGLTAAFQVGTNEKDFVLKGK